MPRLVRFLGVLLFLATIFVPERVLAQCLGLPTVSALGSNKFPGSFCSPVNATVNYNVNFLTPVPTGALDLVIDWGDGGAQTVVPQVANGATNSYTYSGLHNFPVDSDCEFLVVITMRYNGVLCPNTRQQQKVASWRTDEFNGGNIQLISPETLTNEHLVCRGQDISVIFDDQSEFNCAADYTHLGTAIETPNIENRWQQIVYNTPIGGSKIPNVRVAGVPVTGAGGGDIIANYQDPRGVFRMAAPVVLNDPRRRDAQVITAPGGFGAGFPQVGDVFEVTIRYWNFCNPYSNNLAAPMVPVNGDLINGDNAPVERTALIRIVDSPPAPGGGDQTVCNGVTPGAFSISGVPANNIVNWYRNNAGDVPGTLITSGPSTTLPITSHPNWVNNTTPGIYKVWASYEPNVVGGMNCESPKILLTRIIREPLAIPDPNPALPTEVCNGIAASPTTVTISLPGPATETIGGATTYTFTGSAGVTATSTTANSATFNINVGIAPNVLFVDRTIRVDRQYTTTPNCSNSRTFTIRVYNRPVGGTPSTIPDVCETTPLGTIVLNGYLGDIVRWEESKDGGAYGTYTGTASGATITPGTRTPGVYRFRAVVKNGPCAEVLSAVETVEVFDSPVSDVTVGADQFWCGPLTSGPMGGTDPMGLGTGTWTYVSSFPAGRPAPTISNIHDYDATITVAPGAEGAYTMRWTIENGTCTDFADIVIDFGSTPTPSNAGTAQNVCGESATLAGNNPVIGFGSWTILTNPSGAGDPGATVIVIADPTSPTSDINLVGPTFRYGTYQLQWQIKSGSCPVSLSTVNISFSPAATVAAFDISTICIGPTTFSPIGLTGTIGGGATGGQWVNVNGNGTITGNAVAGSTVTASYTPVLADYQAGTPIRVKLVANANAPCVNVEQEILINIDRTPLVDAGTDITNICDNNVQLNAENPPPYGATGIWTTSAAGITFDDPTDPRTFVRGLPASPLPNTTIVRWTLTSASGLCAAPPVSINLTRVSPPIASSQIFTECEVIPAGAPVVTNIVLTNYQAAILAASGGTSITWYRNSAPPTGTIIPNPAVAQTNIADGQTYIARVTGGSGCTSDVQVTIRVRALPPALDKDVALCEDVIGSNTASGVDLTQVSYINALTGGAAGVTVAWFDNQADASNNTTPITAPFDVTGNRTVYGRVTYNTSPNCSDIGEIRLAVKNLPTNADIFGRESVCQGDPSTPPDELPVEIYQVTPITGAKYYWDIPDNPATEFKVFGGGTEDDFFVLLQFPNRLPAGLTIRVHVEINGCSGPVIEKLIKVNENPPAPDILGELVVCENDNGILYTVPSSNYPASSYSWEIRKASDNSLGGAFVADGQTTDEIRVNFLQEDVILTVRESNAICVSPDKSINITINQRPVIANNDAAVCSDAPSGVVLQADATSPVPIDHYSVMSEVITAGLTPAQLNLVPGNFPATAIQNKAFENLTAVPLPVNYTVQPIAVGVTGKECPGAPEIITLTIQPEPQLDPNLDRVVCSGTATQIILVSALNTFPADKFLLDAVTLGPNTSLLSPAALPAADGVTLYNSDLIKDHIFENIGSGNETVSYTIRPYSSLIGCSGNPASTVNVTVNPKSIVDPIAPIEVCSGTALNVPFTSTNNPPPAGPAFLWTVVAPFDPLVTITGPTSGTGNIIGMMVSNSSLTQDAVITFQVQAQNNDGVGIQEGTCLGPVQTFTVTVLKAPKAISLDLVACSNTAGGNTYTANLKALEVSIVQQDPVPAGVTITWYSSATFTAPNRIAPGALNAYLVTHLIPVYAVVKTVATGCESVAIVRYTVNPGLEVVINPGDVVNVDCFGADNGSILANVNGGTPSFTYSLNGIPLFVSAASSQPFGSLVGGTTYTIKVEDSKGCVGSSNPITIGSPADLTLDLTGTDITCFLGTDGKIVSVVGGGQTPYKEFRILETGFVDPDNDGTFPNLPFGSYTVRVTDTNNCTETKNITLTQPQQVVITGLDVATDANGYNLGCNNSTDGAIKLTVTGGADVTGPYTYDLINNTNAAFADIVKRPGTGSEEFSKVVSNDDIGWGTYSITAFDSRLCPSRTSIVVINNPPKFDPGIIGSNYTLCENSAAQAITELAPASGGVLNYSYEWQRTTGDPLDPAGWATIPGETTTTYTPTGQVQTPGTYTFRRIVSTVSTLPNAQQCPPLGLDKFVTVTVTPTYTAQIIGPGSVCEASSTSVDIQLLGLPLAGNSVFTANYRNNTETVNDYRGFKKDGITFGTATIPIDNVTADDTYTLLAVTDPNGCPATLGTSVANVHVLKTPVALTVVGDKCEDTPVDLSWTSSPALTYRLDFGDFSPIQTYAPGTLPAQVALTHTYQSAPVTGSTYIAVLYAQNGSCPELSSPITFSMKPSIRPNITPGDPTICGGGVTKFTDLTDGVQASRWYYRPVGTTDVLGEQTGPAVNVEYTLDNFTTQNPITYEFVYEASSPGNCTGTRKYEVKVYRNVVADFNYDEPIPAFSGGVAEVKFHNNSTPANGGAGIEYNWSFGDVNADIPTALGWGPDYDVKYPSAGDKRITLKVTNLDAQAVGETCESILTKLITIPLPSVEAIFKATPLASCAPTLITTQNLSPGADTFEWVLYNGGTVVATSSLATPTFEVSGSGTYTLTMKASYRASHQSDDADPVTLEVYPTPIAAFEFRPNPVYVPDTELSTFNISKGADKYFWDFDDGYTSDLFQDKHTYKLEGKYTITLIASANNGNKDVDGDGVPDGDIVCYDTARQVVAAITGGAIKIPNAFTPNPNGSTGGSGNPANGSFNDVFLPISSGVEEFTMQIFDRWGNLIFQSKDKNVGWDGYDRNGKLMPAGVYVYKLELRVSNGQRTTKVGDVTLIR